jgi:hypothetical protein
MSQALSSARPTAAQANLVADPAGAIVTVRNVT